MERYNIPKDLEEIQNISKGVFAKRVNKAVMETAHSELVEECSSLKKTSNIRYHEFKTQDYLLKMFPAESRTIFKWRSRTLDVKSHLTYKYKDTECRGCGDTEETLDHIINCGSDEPIAVEDVTKLKERSCNEVERCKIESVRAG